MRTINNLKDAKLVIPDIIAEFMDCLDRDHEVLGDVYNMTFNVMVDPSAMSSIGEWISNKAIPIPHVFKLESIASHGNTMVYTLVAWESVIKIIACSNGHPDDNSDIKLPLEVYNDLPVDVDRAMKATRDLCS